MHIVNTIVPIFVVLFTGVILRRMRFLPPEVLGPLNRLVFYVAIPAMIFLKVARASWQAHFHLTLLLGTLLPVLLAFGLARIVSGFLPMQDAEAGSFVQCSVHGNLGYIGLAVCFYALGDDGLTRASILAGFLMLLQNLVSVLSLLGGGNRRRESIPLPYFISRIVVNPVIIAALAGIGFSLSELTLPVVLDRSLEIVSGMALPLALLVIGASLSFGLMRHHLFPALSAGLIKLVILPCLGVLGFWSFGLDISVYAPGLLLLAAPTATVSVVMAGEMGGAVDLASAAVAVNTLLSAVAYTLWLSLL